MAESGRHPARDCVQELDLLMHELLALQRELEACLGHDERIRRRRLLLRELVEQRRGRIEKIIISLESKRKSVA